MSNNSSNRWSQGKPTSSEARKDPLGGHLKTRLLPGLDVRSMLQEVAPKVWARRLIGGSLIFAGVFSLVQSAVYSVPALNSHIRGVWEVDEESETRGSSLRVRSMDGGKRYLIQDGIPLHRIKCQHDPAPNPCREWMPKDENGLAAQTGMYWPHNLPYMSGMALALPLTEYIRGSSPNPDTAALRFAFTAARRLSGLLAPVSEGGHLPLSRQLDESLADEAEEEEEEQAAAAEEETVVQSAAAAGQKSRKLASLHVGLSAPGLLRVLRERFHIDITLVEPDQKLLQLAQGYMDLRAGPHANPETEPELAAQMASELGEGETPGGTQVFNMDPLVWLLGQHCYQEELRKSVTAAAPPPSLAQAEGAPAPASLEEPEEQRKQAAADRASVRLAELLDTLDVLPNDMDFGLASERAARERAMVTGKAGPAGKASIAAAAAQPESVLESLRRQASELLPKPVLKLLSLEPASTHTDDQNHGEQEEEDLLIPSLQYPGHAYDMVFVDLNHQKHGMLPNLRHRLFPLHLRRLLRPGGVCVVDIDPNTDLPPLARHYSREFQHIYTAEQPDGHMLMFCFYDDPDWRHPEYQDMMENLRQGRELTVAERDEYQQRLREQLRETAFNHQSRVSLLKLAPFARGFSRREALPLDCAQSLYVMGDTYDFWAYLPLVMNMTRTQRAVSGTDKFHVRGTQFKVLAEQQQRER